MEMMADGAADECVVSCRMESVEEVSQRSMMKKKKGRKGPEMSMAMVPEMDVLSMQAQPKAM